MTNNSKADVYRQAANDTAGIVLISSSNNKFISTEYDAFCFSSSDDLNYYMAQKNQAIPIDWVLSHVKSSTWVACPCGLNDSSMTSCWNSEGTWLDGGHGRGLSQWGAYYLATQKGYTFDQILIFEVYLSFYPQNYE